MSHDKNLFTVKDEDGYIVFDDRFRDTTFLYEHLSLYPTDPFKLKDKFGRTVFHRFKHDEDFIKYCLRMWPTNILEVNDILDNNIFHLHQFSEEFFGFCSKLWPGPLYESTGDYIARVYSTNIFDLMTKSPLESTQKLRKSHKCTQSLTTRKHAQSISKNKGR